MAAPIPNSSSPPDQVTLFHLSAEEPQAPAGKAHQMCPYSNATLGNIFDVEVRVAQD